MDSTTVAVTVGSGLWVGLVVEFFKRIIENWLKPDNPMHDITIQIAAAFIGAGGFVIHAWTLAPLTGTSFWDAAGQGGLAGLSAIGIYHGYAGIQTARGKALLAGAAPLRPINVTRSPIETFGGPVAPPDSVPAG